MRARLVWRLLAVPRLILAMGVIVVAVVAVALPRRRRPRPVRRPPTSDDPVADALAEARPVSRFPSDEPDLDVNDLRWIVSVAELEPIDEEGHNTLIGLDDEVASYADVDDDGLDGALADQPGIDTVLVDGEQALVRSVLSLPDVHAATIRALLAINRRPRPPRRRPLPPSAMNTVADGVAATMTNHGFVGRLRGSLDTDEPDLDDQPGPGFYRATEDRLVQVVRLKNGHGWHNDDGAIVDAYLGLTVEVVEIATADVADSIDLERGCQVIAGERILSTSHWMPATIPDVERVLAREALPLCDSTTSRAAIVERWVRDLPWYVPDRLRWEAADLAARWGFRTHARDLVTYGVRRLPQAAAVKAKYRL